MDIFNYIKDNFKTYTVEECKQLENRGAFGVIYMTQCKVNGKLYIGQRKLSNGFTTYIGSGKVFKQAVKKYGKDKFERIILEIAYSQEELDNFEIKYIRLFDASEKYNKDLFYNIALGGNAGGVCLKGEDNPMYGKHHSEEVREKISESKKGKERSEEIRRQMSEVMKGENNPNYGKHRSEETKEKISEAKKGKYAGENNPMYGKQHSEETKKKLGEARKGVKHHMYGKHHSEETKKKMSEAKKGENNPMYGKHHPMYGKHHSEEARKKISESRRRIKYSEETKKKMSESKKGIKSKKAKPLVCIFPDGRIIRNVCIKELALELKVTKDLIRSILKSKKPYKVPNRSSFEYLKPLEGVIIIEEKDYLKEQNIKNN